MVIPISELNHPDKASFFSLTFVAESLEGCRNLGPCFLQGLSLVQPNGRSIAKG